MGTGGDIFYFVFCNAAGYQSNAAVLLVLLAVHCRVGDMLGCDRLRPGNQLLVARLHGLGVHCPANSCFHSRFAGAMGSLPQPDTNSNRNIQTASYQPAYYRSYHLF